MRRSNTSDVHRQGCLGFCVSQIVSQNKFEQAAQIALDENTPMSCMLCFCTNDDLCNDALCSTALQYIMLCLNGLVVKHMPQGAAPA